MEDVQMLKYPSLTNHYNLCSFTQEMIMDIVKEFASENDMTTEMVEGYLNSHISRQVATVVRTEVLKGGF